MGKMKREALHGRYAGVMRARAYEREREIEKNLKRVMNLNAPNQPYALTGIE